MRIKITIILSFFYLFSFTCTALGQVNENQLKELSDSAYSAQDSAMSLYEVVVTGTPPMFTDEEDKITMHIENTPLSEAGSARDILQKSSKIKADDRYGVFVGLKEAMLIIDGREITDPEVLDMLSSNEISKVDIITSPSIRYDSRARAIIEITTIKGGGKGIDAKVNTRMTKGEYWSKLVGTKINANFSKFSFFSSYIYSPNTRKNNESYLRDGQWAFSPQATSMKSVIDEKINTDQDHKLRLGGEYHFSDNHKLGLEFSFHSSAGDKKRNTTNYFYDKGIEIPHSSAPYYKETNDFDKSYITGTTYYRYMNKSGFRLTSSLDISNMENGKTNIKQDGVLRKYANNGNESDIFIFKTDAIIPLPKDFKLEAGFKYTYRHSDSYQDTLIKNENYFDRLSKYDFKRKIAASYVLLSKQFNKVRVGAGVRVEYLDAFAKTDTVIENKVHWDFSPTVELSYIISKKLKIDFSYVMNTYRPSFEELNPIRDYVDEIFFMTGNPELTREKRHNWNLKASYKRTSIGVNYVRQYDAVAWFMDQVERYNEKGELVGFEDRVSKKNIKRSDMLSFDMLTHHFNNYMDGFLASGLIFTNNEDDALQGMNMKDPIWYIFMGGVFDLPYDLKLNMSHRYFTKGLINVLYFKPVYRSDIGISRSFLNDKLNASFMWNDVFRTDKMKTYTTINGRNIRHTYFHDLSTISLSLNYKFNLKK